MRSPVPTLVDASVRRPWLTLAVGAVLVALALFVAMARFDMTTSTAELISPDVDWRQQEQVMETAFPQLRDVMIIIVDGRTPELAEDGAARLAARLATDDKHFRLVRRPDGGDFFARHGLLFSDTDAVRKTTAALIEAQPMLGPLAADPSLRGVMTALTTVLDGVDAGEASLASIEKPMRALSDAIEPAAAGRPAYFSWTALLSGDGASLSAPTRRIILAQPVLDHSSLMAGEAASASVHAAARALALTPAHGVTVQLTGEVPLADEEFATLEENIGLVALVMVLAMLVTLWLATRSVRLVTAIMVTTVAGLVVTAALGLLAVGRFNLISVAFIPLFVGLGIDFGIQICVRFNAERAAGSMPVQAMRDAAAALGTPLALAAGAICLGFAAFLPTAYIGIAELGLISGVGMVIALLFSVTLLPALVMVLSPPAPRGDTGLRWLAPADDFLEAKRGQVLWAFAIATVLSIVSLGWITFDFNPLHLRDPDAPSMRTLADLTRDPDRTPNTIDVLATNADAARALKAKLDQVPEVAQVIDADSFVPADQDAKLALISDAGFILDLTLNPFDVAPAPTDADRIAALRATAARLNAAGAQDATSAGAQARRLAAALDRLATADPARRAAADAMLALPLGVTLNQIRQMLSAGPVTRETLPPDLLRDWVTPDGRHRVQVQPRGNAQDNDVLIRFTAAVAKVAPAISGLPVATQRAAGTVAGAFVQAGAGAFLLVSLLLYVVLRDVREVVFTLAPVVLSIFLTLGSCVVIGQPINFANIIAFPLLFGVGVAFHIYFVMAWRAGATKLLQSSLARAVMLSAMATGMAFGALCLSAHPGTASMGLILMISLIWTLVCALIFEPALLGPPRSEKGTAR